MAVQLTVKYSQVPAILGTYCGDDATPSRIAYRGQLQMPYVRGQFPLYYNAMALYLANYIRGFSS